MLAPNHGLAEGEPSGLDGRRDRFRRRGGDDADHRGLVDDRRPLHAGASGRRGGAGDADPGGGAPMGRRARAMRGPGRRRRSRRLEAQPRLRRPRARRRQGDPARADRVEAARTMDADRGANDRPLRHPGKDRRLREIRRRRAPAGHAVRGDRALPDLRRRVEERRRRQGQGHAGRRRGRGSAERRRRRRQLDLARQARARRTERSSGTRGRPPRSTAPRSRGRSPRRSSARARRKPRAISPRPTRARPRRSPPTIRCPISPMRRWSR